MSVELKPLIKKLNPVCHQSLLRAAELCVSNTHYNVEPEHFVLKLMEQTDTDIKVILEYYSFDPGKILEQCTGSIDGMKRGNSRTPAMSPHIVTLFQEAWLIASMTLGESTIRSGAVLMALLSNDALRGVLLDSVPLMLQVPLRDLSENIGSILQESRESGYAGSSQPRSMTSESSDRKSGPRVDSSILDLYTINITARASANEIDPVEGRDTEIRRIVDILMRRRQNNPILTGDAGVGKTAIVEGFALKVCRGEVPEALKEVQIRMLDLGLLQAGAGVKGEFEQRLKDIIKETGASPVPVILFIDEAHTLIGAGGQAGQSDAANLLKPALARGELRTIAATTWSEYKKYFEKDHALVRRFQVIHVDEPAPDLAIRMLRSVSRSLETFHKVRILDEAVVDAVKLSHRYISGRKLPDKAVSLLDTACARVATSQGSLPAEIEDAERRIKQLGHEMDMLVREQYLNGLENPRIEELSIEKTQIESERQALQSRWDQEKKLVDEIISMTARLESEERDDTAGENIRETLLQLKDELAKIQGKNPMSHIDVDANIIASIVSDWTGIPAGKIMRDEIRSVLTIKEKMEERLIGQSHALDAISRRIRTSRVKLDDPGKPIGVFLLVGPSGVGKTETALTLAELLYGGEENVIAVNMSEYQEAHTVSSLKGAPPGYVGYGAGGVLTEAVRRKPFSVVLLDEVEKAHPDVMELFYQVFDKGIIEDGEGVQVNFKNCIILLTSNIGSESIAEMCFDETNLPDPELLVDKIRPQLLSHFKPALLGRLNIIPYYQLGRERIEKIVELKLARIKKRFQENNPAELTFDRKTVEVITARCTDVDSGARNIDTILTHTLLPELSEILLGKMAAGEPFTNVDISVNEGEGFTYTVS